MQAAAIVSQRLSVSVVITAYNLENFIGPAVRSALAQTRPPDEVIVVNDCSTDSTGRALTEFGNSIRVINQPTNQGALRAALRGLTESSGQVVSFLDGDDLWHPQKLERCVGLMDADPSLVLVSHQHTRIDAAGRDLGIRDETHQNIDAIIAKTNREEQRSELYKQSILEKRGYWLGSAYSIRRTALDLTAFQGWVDSLPHPEDVYLDLVLAPWIVLSNPDLAVGLVDAPLFDYRIHANNSCNDYRDVERALRSIRRAYNTTLAANDLNRRFAHLEIARNGALAHDRAIAHYELLLDLYGNRRLRSIRRLTELLASRSLTVRQTLTELVRVTAVVAGGPELLLRLKSRVVNARSRLNQLRQLMP